MENAESSWLLRGKRTSEMVSALASELKSPSYLDVSCSVDDPTSATGHAEVTVTWPPIDGTKSVPVERIGEVEL